MVPMQRNLVTLAELQQDAARLGIAKRWIDHESFSVPAQQDLTVHLRLDVLIQVSHRRGNVGREERRRQHALQTREDCGYR